MKNSGFSLPEVIISGAIILALFGLLLETMLPEVKHSITGKNVADVQEEAVNAHRRVLRDLRETDMRYVRNLTNPGFGCVAISFPTARLNGSGDFQTTTSPGLTDPLTLAPISAQVPDWRGYIIYYQDTNDNILYKSFFPSTPATARLSPSDTCSYAVNGIRVAEGVLAFRVLSGDPPTTGGPTTTDPTKGPLDVILTDNKIYASQNNNIRIEGAVNPLINFSVY